MKLADYHSPYHTDVSIIPEQNTAGRILKFQANWFAQYRWLHFCQKVSKVICFYCKKANEESLLDFSKRKEMAFIDIGFANWKKAIEKCKCHEASNCHKLAMEKLMSNITPINTVLASEQIQDQQRSRDCMTTIITSITFLMRQGLAL